MHSKLSLIVKDPDSVKASAAVAKASMLGVMTLNAGYIIALLVGVFAGELAFGRHRLSAAR